MTANLLTYEISYDTPIQESNVTETNVAATFPTGFTASGSVMLIIDLTQQSSKDAAIRAVQILQKYIDQSVLFKK